MTGSDIEDLERAEAELEEWLAAKATDGVPELVLIGVLREYADEVERLGSIPRTWEPNDADAK